MKLEQYQLNAKLYKMRKAEIKMHGRTAGWLTHDELGYRFVYEPAYLNSTSPEPVSLTLPLHLASIANINVVPHSLIRLQSGNLTYITKRIDRNGKDKLHMEDMALTLDGRKKKLKRGNFIAAFDTLKLDVKQQENIFKKMEMALPKWLDFIEISFLSGERKDAYKQLIRERFARMKNSDA